MRVVVQRVISASVEVAGEPVARIEQGLVALVGAAEGDTDAVAQRLARKVAELRVFADDQGKMNLSVLDVGGSVLVVSQFTLLADSSSGRRPSFAAAARPDLAAPVVEGFAIALERVGLTVRRGVFGAHMKVELINDGPVTIILEGK